MATDWTDPEQAAFAGPDAGLPVWYEFVASPPATERPAPAPPPPRLAPPPEPPLPAIEVVSDKASDGALALATAPADTEAGDGSEATERGFVPALWRLSVVPDIEGPHVRLGVAWAVVAGACAAAGRFELAGWLALVAFAAGGQAARSWRRRPQQPAPQVVIAGSVLLPLAAPFGVVPMAAAAGLIVVAAVVAGGQPFWVREVRHTGPRAPKTRINPAVTVALALGIGLAAAAPVLARQRGAVASLVLLAMVGVYDGSAYIVGGSNAWEGPLAGVAFVGAVTLAVAALLVPPFGGAPPWILGGLAAALAPVGPLVATILLGDRAAPAPALRRLDSLLVLGPLWAAAALVLLK